MSTLNVIVAFTRNSGDTPATGLTLTDISLYLTAVAKSDGARTVIWNGTQTASFEVTNVGAYGRLYTSADLDTYDYVAGALYGGGVSLDQDYVSGATSEDHAGAWSYATRTLTQSAASVTAAVSGSTVSILRGDTVIINRTGLGNIEDRSKLWFTVKRRPAVDADSEAIIQVEETAGLIRLNGSASTAAWASLTVTDAVAGDVTIVLEKQATVQLAIRSGMAYDIQELDTSGDVTTLTEGVCNVTADSTRAIS